MTRMKRLGTTPAIVAAMLVVGWSGAARAADPEHGLEVAEHWCDGCHVIHQRDPGWHSGNAAPRFSLLTKTTPDAMRKLLRGGHGIDAIRALSDADIDDITAHIHRLTPEEQ
jgi:mono/diheme cytochrome c family protein